MKISSFLLLLALAVPSLADEPNSHTADVRGIRIHYFEAGTATGPALILLHGFPQSASVWKPLLPALGAKFHIIAPDLPGFGESAIPRDGLDISMAAERMHALAVQLKLGKVRIAGHDLGAAIAYSYAGQFPADTEKLVLLDGVIPGVDGWERIYNAADAWGYRFQGATPEALVQGRERTYLDHFWSPAVSEADRKVYAAAFARPGRLKAAWGYYASLPKSAKELADVAKNRIRTPLLIIGGDKGLGDTLSEQAKLIATDGFFVMLRGAGHWIIDERPRETADALLRFLI